MGVSIIIIYTFKTSDYRFTNRPVVASCIVEFMTTYDDRKKHTTQRIFLAFKFDDPKQNNRNVSNNHYYWRMLVVSVWHR